MRTGRTWSRVGDEALRSGDRPEIGDGVLPPAPLLYLALSSASSTARLLSRNSSSFRSSMVEWWPACQCCWLHVKHRDALCS